MKPASALTSVYQVINTANAPASPLMKKMWRWRGEVGVGRRFKHITVQLKCDGTRLRTGGEVKGKLANGVGSQYSSHYLGTWCIQHYYR